VETSVVTIPNAVPPGTLCRRCLYGIKGLSADGVCTECGAPVAGGADPAWWANRPPDTLKGARDAARRALIAAACTCVLSIVSLFVWYGPTAVTQGFEAAQLVFTILYAGLTLWLGVMMFLFWQRAADLWIKRPRVVVAISWFAIANALLAVTALAVMYGLSSAGSFSQTLMYLWCASSLSRPLLAVAYGVTFMRLGGRITSRPIRALGLLHGVLGAVGVLLALPTCYLVFTPLIGSYPSWAATLSSPWYQLLNTGVFYGDAFTLAAALCVVLAAIRRVVNAREAAA
jgi:hypothetical protein